MSPNLCSKNVENLKTKLGLIWEFKHIFVSFKTKMFWVLWRVGHWVVWTILPFLGNTMQTFFLNLKSMEYISPKSIWAYIALRIKHVCL